VSRREQIRMSAAEVAAFLAEERTATCATLGLRGWPHLMPLWYVLRPIPAAAAAAGGARGGQRHDVTADTGAGGGPGVRLWAWTYAASQKVRNLERDPRATLQVEAGDAYHELHGVMLECEVLVHRDVATVATLGEEILLRNSVARGEPQPSELPLQARAMVEAQATKRVSLEFVEQRRASWDHRKLGGVY
jgi:nitroimidazol reductase NimA-like FMN-containing flavoprotein (pyridoxamine 5'-phosphate oxidase superfamily)